MLLKLLGALIVLLYLFHFFKNYLLVKLKKAPPVITSWYLPFFGCIIPFSRGPPSQFILQCQKKYGNIFTIHVGGRYMTFLFDPSDYPLFFNGAENIIDFQNATAPFLTKGFKMSREEYFRAHNISLNKLRVSLLPRYLAEDQHDKKIFDKLQEILKEEWKEKNGKALLFDSIKFIIFRASTYCLFGDSFGDNDKKKIQQILHQFEKFDSNFELASSNIPLLFLSSFRTARSYLLSLLNRLSHHYMSSSSSSSSLVAYKLMTAVDPNYPNSSSSTTHSSASWLLGALWATEANSIPITFWIFTELLKKHNQHYLQKIATEISTLQSKFHKNDNSSSSSSFYIKYEDFTNEMPTLKGVIYETIRLYASPIIVRQTLQNVKVKDVIIPANRMLCLSPLWSHRNNSEAFADPLSFFPERWFDGKLEKNKNLSFISFGGGQYRCPGKYFALVEIAAIVSAVIMNYDLEMLPNQKINDDLVNWISLVGVLKPQKDYYVSYKPKNEKQHKKSNQL